MSMQASKRTLQASVLSVHCLQTNEHRGTKCAFILVEVRPTVMQSLFHTEFLSSIRFSPLWLLQRWKRTRNFIASGHEEELKLGLSTTKANYMYMYSDKNHRIKNSSLACLFCSTEITLQVTLHMTNGGEFYLEMTGTCQCTVRG